MHNQLVRQVVASWGDMETDMVLLSRDGEKVVTQRLLLSFFSPQVRAICADIPTGESLTMSIPASKTSLDTLLVVLSTGTVITSSRDDLLDVTETAACLGIELKDIQIGVKNDKSLEEEKHVEKKVSKRGRKKKSENENKAIKKRTNLNDPAKTVDSYRQESQQTPLDENVDEDASGINEDIDRNENEESDRSDGETGDIIEPDDKQFKKKSRDCSECGKSFSSSIGLKQHRIVHTGEKPFKCDQCEKSFGQRGALHNHKVLHSGEKPFKCEVCDKAFTQKGNMKSHTMKVHSGL